MTARRSRHQRVPCVKCGGDKPPGRRHETCGLCGEHIRIPLDEQHEMIRLYLDEGFTLKQIGERVFCANATVSRVLRIHGVPRRRRTRPPEPKIGRDAVDRTVELYLSGLSLRQVAAELGISYSAVRGRLHRAGVPLRGRADGQIVYRRHALASLARSALTPCQAEALDVLERDPNRWWTSREITAIIGAPTRGRTYRSLEQLEARGLVVRGKKAVNKTHERTWKRSDVQFADLLDTVFETPAVGNLPAAEMLPIGPFRAWLNEWVAREERKAKFMAVTPVKHYNGDGSGGISVTNAIAERLGIIDRRLYALRFDQDRISITLADQLLTRADRGVTIFDLWPHLDTAEEAA